jgi:tRNA(Ile)-lysidine synthase
MSGVDGLDLGELFGVLAGRRKLALAVSGGPDSLALMLLAAEWSRDSGVSLVVYTVDHGLRRESAAESAMVAGEAARLGLEVRVLHWEGEKPETGVQAAARKARYRLMADAMDRDGAELLLTAHHLGDQAETVLMRMAHGSGINGLRGMDVVSFVEGCEIFRPLLGIDPEDLATVVERAGLTPARDASNNDRHYERVRWRQLLPMLAEMGLEPRRIGRFAERMAAATMLVAEAADDEWPTLAMPRDDGSYEMRQERFMVLNPLVGVQILGQMLELVSGDRRDPPLGALESLAGKLRGRESMKPATLHGCVVSADGETIVVRKENPRRQALEADPAVTAN